MTTFNTTYRIIQFLQNHGSFVRSNINENNKSRQYLFGTLIRNFDEIGDILFIGSVIKLGEEIKVHDCTYLTSKNNEDLELPNYNYIIFIADDNSSTKDAEDYSCIAVHLREYLQNSDSLSYRAKMQECNCLKGKKFCFCDSILLDLDFWYILNLTDTRPMSNSIETTSQNRKKKINVQIVRKDINL
ncbi:25160_t:CDS:2, partial [Racocetra persica]